MDYEARDAVHKISLDLAQAVFEADKRGSEDFLILLELYRGVRRMLPRGQNGKRWGAAEAYDMCQYGPKVSQ